MGKFEGDLPEDERELAEAYDPKFTQPNPYRVTSWKQEEEG